MNKAKLKTYAPQARRDFIQAMTDRAAFYGLTAKRIAPVLEQGDFAVIDGRSFPRSVAKKRKALENRINRNGFQQTMEAVAYTWFNRLVAIRYMELHGYLDHGYRVLSGQRKTTDGADSTDARDGASASAASSYVQSVKSVVQTPEILEHAEHVDLPGLKRETVIDLKLAGNRESELYRLLLTAQCNALHTAMPFLFEKIDHETELLLPDNLLNSDSLMRKLVGEIEEEDWNEVEIIGWLYQFYISERKDEVIGKVVASEDIPAATQLFTPNWIVKYLVQNTLGRQWLATYPQSALRQQMEYYIEPAEQTPEVQEQLKAITPTSLNPEELTLLDPACGSGHILVEAYDLFKAIYQERGYRAKDIPALILQKNLFGMEIDDRAAQLAAFALMMKARADDRRIFDSEAKPNILAFEDSKGMKANEIHFALTSPLKGEEEGELESPAPDGHLFEPDDNLFTRAEAAKAAASRTPTSVNFSQADIAALLELFENAKTFGSLIQIPPKLVTKLPEIEKRLDDVLKHGDFTHTLPRVFRQLVRQAQLLASQFGVVVTNPPYMGSKGMEPLLKAFVAQHFSHNKADLFSAFIDRCYLSAETNGELGFMTPFTWMFIKSYERLRERLLSEKCITTLVQPEYHAFFESAYVPICAFTIRNANVPAKATFIDLSRFYGEDAQPQKTLEAIRAVKCDWKFIVSSGEMRIVPGSPIAFAVSDRLRLAFTQFPAAGDSFFSDGVTKTGDNEKFLRQWWEVTYEAALNPDRYRRCARGGDARRYYGNVNCIVDWRPATRQHYGTDHVARITPEYLWATEGITWTNISSKGSTFRIMEAGTIAETVGPVVFPRAERTQLLCFLGFLNSVIAENLLRLINPTLHTHTSDILKMPLFCNDIGSTAQLIQDAIDLAKDDWSHHETSSEFQCLPLLVSDGTTGLVQTAFATWQEKCLTSIGRMKEFEEENNRLFIDAYGLKDELSPAVPDDQITLYRPDRTEDIKRLLSYAIGCMMGRYSLDKPGLIYAHSGSQGFDPSQYKTFRADDDGIIPLLETDWGILDDATDRFVEFIGVTWPKKHLEENLKFVADSLGSNNGEQPRDTIRRYLATGFYKHHLSMYKKRPIYWLFSSGKQRAFQCLVYLHRYHEGTLARMRTEYVIPLIEKYKNRIAGLKDDIARATSTSHRKKLQKSQDDLKKKLAELSPIESWSDEGEDKAKRSLGTFEEKLKHVADQKISLDLDDGVKVNYAKFGDLMAESKAICGAKDDD